MGLDITAYSNLVAVGVHTENWCADWQNHVEAFAYDSFPQSFRGIPILASRRTSDEGFLVGGCFARTDKTETFGFRAGSYSGYGVWRTWLRSRFNPNCDPQRPFYELIWFADNEGSIGPEAAVDLLTDFLEHESLVDPAEEWMKAKYEDWTHAFVLAANSGLVRFH